MDTYGSRKEDWEDLDVTREELQNLSECLKKEEFRKLLIEYAEEVTDPENRKIYEKEITQLEKERGVDVTFVNPEPGYVIKTSVDGDRKCFLNISKSDIVARPTSHPSCEEGHRGLQWSIPYTLVPPRDDLDKKNVRCTVFDVVFHSDTIYLASKNARFHEIVNNTAMDGVESNFKVKLDRKNVKFPKINFKGVSHPTVIRKPSKEPPKEAPDIEPEIYQKLMSSYDKSRQRQSKCTVEKPERSPPPTVRYKKHESQEESENSLYVTPKFLVKHQTNIEMDDFTNGKDSKMHAAIPKKLVVTVDLPLLRSASDAILDVQERTLSLKSEKPAKYQLTLPLPYCVDAEQGNAKFDPKYKKLTVTLPVIRAVTSMKDSKEDSGVDSDHGSPVPTTSESTSEKLLTINGESDSELTAMPENQRKSIVEVIEEKDDSTKSCDNSVLKTSDTTETIDTFMQSSIKYTLPTFTCNIYDNQLAVTINVKNVDPDSIRHRVLHNNSGIHVLLTSVGAGFFPQYFSLCFKIGDNTIDPESFSIETWDNNVVFMITVRDCQNLARYYVGLDEEFMEEKDLATVASFNSKLQQLMTDTVSVTSTQRDVEVTVGTEDVVININSNQLDSDDEDEQQHAAALAAQRNDRKHAMSKSRSVSESSGDELPSCGSNMRQAKGILKSRRCHNFSRSVSESSADESIMPVSSADLHYEWVHDGNSESECSSLKKTVRFNDVVSRQLFRSNSSILGQRKKNQRKLRNKKRAHDRRLSESENSETEDREKYKASQKNIPHDSCDNVKPILARDKQVEQERAIDIENRKYKANTTLRKWHDDIGNKEANETSAEPMTKTTKSDVQPEFKNDLIFDLDM